MKEQNELVDAFAETMKIELKANEHKGDWRDWNEIDEMLKELDYHLLKLNNSINVGRIPDIKEHLADCANFLLMIGNAYKLY